MKRNGQPLPNNHRGYAAARVPGLGNRNLRAVDDRHNSRKLAPQPAA
jgi:hypothetical protein